PPSPVIPSSPLHQPPCPPQPQDAEVPSLLFQQVLDTFSALARRVEGLENDKAAHQLEIFKLKERVKKLENINTVKSSKLRWLKKVGTSQRVKSSDDMENVFNQGRMIADMDINEGIELVKDAEDAESEGRNVDDHTEKQAEIYNIDLDHSSKGMKYDEILPIFQASDANIRFLFKSREEMEEEDEEIIKSINETPAQKAAKRRKLHEQAKEDEDLKKQLEVVDDEDDDVFIEATPIGRKVPVVDYEIVMINNKPRYKIIKADGTHQLYISFITLLKNFNREDLEDLWRI
nr:hypothetical protein [Tanacetum cinerariifolium]